jgi:hypothetical protein
MLLLGQVWPTAVCRVALEEQEASTTCKVPGTANNLLTLQHDSRQPCSDTPFQLHVQQSTCKAPGLSPHPRCSTHLAPRCVHVHGGGAGQAQVGGDGRRRALQGNQYQGPAEQQQACSGSSMGGGEVPGSGQCEQGQGQQRGACSPGGARPADSATGCQPLGHCAEQAAG